MAGQKFTEAERSGILSDVRSLWLRGKTAREIGVAVGVSQRQAQRYIAAFRREWKRETFQSVNRRMEAKLAHSEEIKRQAWEEWERSKQPLTEKSTVTVTQPASETTTSATATRHGDPRYLHIIARQLVYEAKLLGLFTRKPGLNAPSVELLPVKIVT